MKEKMRKRALSLVLVLSFLLTALPGWGAAAPGPVEATLNTSVSMKVGDAPKTVSIAANPDMGGTLSGLSCSLASGDAATATASGTSVTVTAVKEGTATFDLSATLTVLGIQDPTTPDVPPTDTTSPVTGTLTVTVDPADPPPPVLPTGITLDPTETTLTVDDQVTLDARVDPADAANPTVSWKTSAADVATVSNGLVTAKGAGMATITATVTPGNYTATCTVTVEAKQPTMSLSVAPTTLSLTAGASDKLAAAVLPENAQLVWTSGSNAIATVDQDGTVHGVKEGKTTITVTGMANGEVKTATCAVTITKAPVLAVTGITLTTPAVTLDPKGTQRLAYTLSPAGISDPGVDWSSSATGVATVSNGVVTAVAPGTATITAKVKGTSFAATCAVEVSGVKLNQTGTLSVNQGGSTPAITAALYGAAKGKTVNWNSNRTNIATVSAATGTSITVKGVAASNDAATITATASGTSYSAAVQVKVNSGTASAINTSATRKNPLVFSSLASNLETQCKAACGNEGLSYITGVSVDNASRGTLYIDYVAANDTGSGVSSGYRFGNGGNYALNRLWFVPKAGASGTVTIAYTGVSTGGKTYTGTIKVSITAASDFTLSTTKNKAVNLDPDHFTNFSRNWNYVQFTLPSANEGRLVSDYSSSGNKGSNVSAGARYYRNSAPYLYNISFVPANDFTGTVYIPFTGTTGSSSFSGVMQINVGGSSSNGDVNYTVARNGYVTFDGADFRDAYSAYNGRTLSYVQFSPPSSSKGYLYYDYDKNDDDGTAVKSTGKYYYSGSPNLDDVTFVPASGYTGTVNISFTAYDTSTGSYSGEVIIDVGGGKSTIEYRAAKNGYADFDADDFNDASKDYNGYALDYVRFTPPSSSRGTLYLNYDRSTERGTKVSSSTNYKRTGTPNLDNITFVPASNYTGTVNISFTGYDSDDGHFTGTVSIEVGGKDNGVSGTRVTYSTAQDTRVKFDADDFNAASKNYDDNTLNYVRFTQPSSSKGTLYHDYSSAGSPGTKVSESTSYYRAKSPRIDDISFVPAKGYTGTVEFDYTGWDSDGGKFTGIVVIRVGSSSEDTNVKFQTTAGRPVTFTADAFNTASKNYSGTTLDYVRFTSLPSATAGTLCYNYSAGGTLSKVTTGTSYYRAESPYLYSVTFVPATGYSGTVEFNYTGYDINGDSFDGKVSVVVGQSAVQPIRYTAVNGVAQFRADDFNNLCRMMMYSDLVKVRFTPPVQGYGRLYYGYTADGKYTGAIDATTDCYRMQTPNLATVAFVAGTGFTGTVSIPYTAEATNGYTYSGTVEIAVPASGARFTDLGSTQSWAGTAIEYLYNAGVVNGTTATTYNPMGSTKRGDFALMIVRAFKFSGGAGTNSFADVPKGAYYADAIAIAKSMGIVQGDGNNFRPETPVTRQDAMVMLQRALRSAGWSIADGTASDLNAFKDKASVYPYAVPAVGAVVKRGIVTGDNNGRINPTAYINRAEMAVILYRALTMSR